MKKLQPYNLNQGGFAMQTTTRHTVKGDTHMNNSQTIKRWMASVISVVGLFLFSINNAYSAAVGPQPPLGPWPVHEVYQFSQAGFSPHLWDGEKDELGRSTPIYYFVTPYGHYVVFKDKEALAIMLSAQAQGKKVSCLYGYDISNRPGHYETVYLCYGIGF
jgi:hypothetical protein